MPEFTPTPEQEAIFTAARTTPHLSIMVHARAGCAKTTTLELVAKATHGGLALAFNTKIKKELESRLPPTYQVLTLNGLGHRVWGNTIGRRCQVDEKKLGRLITTTAKNLGLHLDEHTWNTIRTLCSLAQTYGLLPSQWAGKAVIPDTDEAWQDLADTRWLDLEPSYLPLCRTVLSSAIGEAYQGVLSYDDQILMSALFTSAYPKYSTVLLDEAQDLSELNHRQVSKVASGRLIVCGDDLQSLYAFRGADHNSMENLRALRPAWIDLPLATTFRCPHSIVERQRGHARDFSAFPTNPQGQVHTWLPPTRRAPYSWSWESVATLANGGGLAVLCRNNAPLLSLALRLIRRGVGCVMLGRDIGKGLSILSKKIRLADSMPTAACRARVVEWMDTECALARANGNNSKVTQLTDKGECLIAVLDSGTVGDGKELRERLTELFARTAGKVTLSTIHKAKGLEWRTVVHLDPWRVPSRGAHGAELQQELNAIYVCETRAKEILILANLEHLQ